MNRGVIDGGVRGIRDDKRLPNEVRDSRSI